MDTNDEELLKAALDAGCYPDPDGRRYIRSLMVACRDGHANLARMLLDAGAELNLTDDERTALMFSASRGDAELVRMLLERGADPLAGTKTATRRCRLPPSP
ncbi:MAG: ankyrin repeat domain-containing protein [Desulfovibrio sp.]|nr:ankyrin repeat domain-containing protein [Desulfovibrio sp.]